MRLLAVGCAAEDLDVGHQPEHHREALAHDTLVVDQHDLIGWLAASCRNPQLDRNPSLVGAACEASAQQLGALAHAGQAIAAGERSSAD